MLADLESVEKRIQSAVKRARGNDKEAKADLVLLEAVQKLLVDGKPARALEVDRDDRARFRSFQLLSSKPVVYVCNVEEESAGSGNGFSESVAKYAADTGAQTVAISAAIEAEIAQLGDEAEKQEYLETIGLEETGLARVIRAGYSLLDLVTFFTAGPKEARAWTVKAGSSAPKAAGVIHTDFEKGFIRAETIAYDDYIACNGEQGAKDTGKMRLEGKDYIVQDGDVMHFRFNV
jgi:GTP-binding protein YchF